MNRHVAGVLASMLLAACAHQPPHAAALVAPRPIGETGGPGALLDQYARTGRFRLGAPESVTVAPDSRVVYFLRSGPRSFARELWAWDVASRQERRVLTAEQLLGGAEETLTAEERARRQRTRSAARGIASFALSPDGVRILVPLSGRLYAHDVRAGTTRALDAPGDAPVDARWSPDGRRIACVRDGDVYVLDAATGAQQRLTHGATETLRHGTAEFVAQEEMDRMEGWWWSPDGASIAYQETDESAVERFHLADPLHPERAADAFAYPRAGRTNARVRLGVIPVAGGATTWIQWDREAFPYLARVVWERGGPLTLVVQNRAQTELRILGAAADGATRALWSEHDAAWVNLDASVPRWLPDGSGFLWSSEREGAWQLERHAADGSLGRVLLPPAAGYRSVVGLDDDGLGALVLASEAAIGRGVRHVVFDGTAAETLDDAAGECDVAARGDLRVLHCASLHARPTWTVLQGGHAIGALRSDVEEPVVAPQVELEAVGSERFAAAIVRPSNHRPGMRWPVILQVYGGPGASMVGLARSRYLFAQGLAEHGFVVVSVDGRGTPNRGRAWERALHRAFADVPLGDQIAALTALGARHPEMDLGRVGVYGWSFGGYLAALATMRRPDVFRAGVAGAPVADWRDYDTHYTERYLGVPTGDDDAVYREASLLRWAPELRRPLLVVHGTADDNVYFLHGLRLSDALLRADRDHEFLPLAGAAHGVSDPSVAAVLDARVVRFFRDHLGVAGGAH